jgi:type II secretory pathway pseudopilin PulG
MFRPRLTCRRGFTLSQLLVVLALLLILFGLFLPALQKVREAARRAEDSNNLKQICLATINASDTNNGKLAPLAGPYPSSDITTPNNGYGTLFFHILPYIEEDNLYKSSLDGTTYRADTGRVAATVVKVYVSPADPAGGNDPVHNGWLAKSNYAANFQVFGDPAKDSLAGRSRFPASITDGTSNTIFFTQRYQVCGGDPCGWSYDGGTAWTPAFAYLNKGKFQPHPTPEHCDSALAQGLFPGGINVGLGDGSVRFVADAITPQTWWSACTPNGGEVLGSDW